MVTENKLRTHKGKQLFSERKTNPNVTAFDLIKCTKQIKQQRLLITFAAISELPSNISTMSSDNNKRKYDRGCVMTLYFRIKLYLLGSFRRVIGQFGGLSGLG